MFKKILVITALAVLMGYLAFGIVSPTLAKGFGVNADRYRNVPGMNCDPATCTSQAGGAAAQGTHYGAGQMTNLPPTTAGELSAAESAALLYMREEEKLAHDVYAALYTKWTLNIFQNISQSEQTHTEAIKVLIDRYGLTDPASSQAGVFTNPDLQKLYAELMERGSQSLAEALKVGAAIEEMDILDLQKRLAQTDNADIQQVFNNLLRGSNNHLRAFSATLQNQTGETYAPQYMTMDAYLATGASTGAGNGMGQMNGQSGNGFGKGRSNRP